METMDHHDGDNEWKQVMKNENSNLQLCVTPNGVGDELMRKYKKEEIKRGKQ